MFIEFTSQREGGYRVSVDGKDQGWSCNQLLVCETVIHPITGDPHYVAVVAKHPPYRVSVSIDGKEPNKEDWFKPPIGKELRVSESGVSVHQNGKGYLHFNWP
jgi:hypothetical protein